MPRPLTRTFPILLAVLSALVLSACEPVPASTQAGWTQAERDAAERREQRKRFYRGPRGGSAPR